MTSPAHIDNFLLSLRYRRSVFNFKPPPLIFWLDYDCPHRDANLRVAESWNILLLSTKFAILSDNTFRHQYSPSAPNQVCPLAVKLFSFSFNLNILILQNPVQQGRGWGDKVNKNCLRQKATDFHCSNTLFNSIVLFCFY